MDHKKLNRRAKIGKKAHKEFEENQFSQII
jgi:hypothetical protein